MVKMMTKRLVGLCALAMSLLLSGCFSAQVEKLPLASAVPAFDDGGSYELFERVDGDHYERQETFVVKRRGDGGYDFVSEKGDVQPIWFHPLTGEYYVGQAKAEKDRKGYVFTIFRILPDEAFFYMPQCDDQDKAKLASFGVELAGRFECLIDNVAEPIGLFAALKLGQPVSKMVRR
jgi:hypothetical protein